MNSITSRCKTSFLRMMSFLTLSLPLVLFSLAFYSGEALATPICAYSDFESADGNLSIDNLCPPETTPDMDWNGFDPTWTGTGTPPDDDPPYFPYRTAADLALGWQFAGQEDDAETNSDTAFSGGTKQDDSCASVKGAKAPNKDDLERIYLSSKTVPVMVNGLPESHTILNLAWARIPQNTTSASAHVAFEFNQGSTPCGVNSDGLVEREPGDMLIVYDFEGGTTEPTIKLARWTETDGEACDIGNHSPVPNGCWGVAEDLTASGIAEAKVNVGMSVLDDIAPDIADTLNDSEFGEAGIDLTEAGVFGPGVCASFGTAFGVSRSSGNSGNAQMKDMVGPVDFNLANCGTVIVRKQTIPDEDPNSTLFGFTSDITTTPANASTAAFSLTDDEFITFINVNPGTGLNVTEDNPTGLGYELTSINCDMSSEGASFATNTLTRAATFDIVAGDTIDCTFTNTKLVDITVTKKVENECVADNGSFDLFIGEIGGSSSLVAEDVGHDGTGSLNNTSPGDYTVAEGIGATGVGNGLGLGDYLSTIVCTDGGTTSTAGTSIDLLQVDEDVSCIITNVRLPTITVIKEIESGAIETFDVRFDLDGIAGTDEEDTVSASTTSTGTYKVTNYNSLTGRFGPIYLSEEDTEDPHVDDSVGEDSRGPLSGFGAYWRCNNALPNSGDTDPLVEDDTQDITIDRLEPGEAVTCWITNIRDRAALCGS